MRARRHTPVHLIMVRLFPADHLAALCRPPAVVIVLSSFVLRGVLAASGAVRYGQFRLGLTLVVCVLAPDLFWLVLSFSWDLLALGPVLLLGLNGVIFSLFLDSTVVSAMVVCQHH
jgi:hypothetical protein